jgi:hypothetical protein
MAGVEIDSVRLARLGPHIKGFNKLRVWTVELRLDISERTASRLLSLRRGPQTTLR